MITNLHKNIMGTTSFDGKFPGMRKAQDFIVYPLKGEQEADRRITIQSDTRIGTINLQTGQVCMSKPHASGAYSHHLQLEGALIGTLSAEDLLMLKAHIFGTANGHAGTNGIVYCDNSGAAGVFGA